MTSKKPASTPSSELTKRQSDILAFIKASWQENRPPTYGDIGRHFGFASPNSAGEHVRALIQKGAIHAPRGKARALRPVDLPSIPKIVNVPLYGNIPAGFADGRDADPEGCISVDVDTLGITPTARTFALQVRGDSMIGRHICDGDIVVCEHGAEPKNGDVVAALIDNESTLKTFVRNRKTAYLKAENPAFPDLIPAAELFIQGVVVSVLRRMRQTPPFA
jgi:repressor LexA